MLLFLLRTLNLKRGPRLAPERLAQIQQQRLKALVRRTIRGSAFYREKYRGIDCNRFTLGDLPPTNKGELMANFDRVVTDPAVTRAGIERFIDVPENAGHHFLDRYVVSHTSGSQGQPMLIVQDQRSLELAFRLQMTRGNNEPVGVREGISRLIDPVRLAVVTLKRGFYPSATLFQHMPAAARRYVNVLWLSQTDPDLNRRLNDFRPQVLTGYAGVLEMLALEAEAGRLRLEPELRQVVNNSEALTDRAKARIQSAFGLHVMNNYATGECTFLSNGCPTDAGAHVNSDWAIMEVVDDEYRPVPDGRPGQKVLITNLANGVQPFIRYEVGDVVTMADTPCHCGSRLPRIARIEGRAADVFWVGEGSRHRRMINLVFAHAFEYLRDVREWQAIQRDRHRVVVRLEPLRGATVDLTRARKALDRELTTYDFQDVQVEFEVVPQLAADPATGKFRRMISLVSDQAKAGPPQRPLIGRGMIGQAIEPRRTHRPTPTNATRG
ncbi:phenylacetate--CoA ligase family protein [Singulisphaera sp. Ch08]|uniref:Phenylacetate--CoA ligase family protein n=1 Tax=Singulisphaera sp. Ch08 TaxID=3120278 RepID=A0AAU7C777_9BACT